MRAIATISSILLLAGKWALYHQVMEPGVLLRPLGFIKSDCFSNMKNKNAVTLYLTFGSRSRTQGETDDEVNEVCIECSDEERTCNNSAPVVSISCTASAKSTPPH